MITSCPNGSTYSKDEGEIDRVIGSGSVILICLQRLFNETQYHKFFTLSNLPFGLTCLSAPWLEIWGAAETIKATFSFAGAVTSFGRKAPVLDEK